MKDTALTFIYHRKKFRIKKTQKKGFGGTKEPHQKSSDAKPGNNE